MRIALAIWIGIMIGIVAVTTRASYVGESIDAINLQRMNTAMHTSFATLEEAEAEWRQRLAAQRQPAEKLPERFTIQKLYRLGEGSQVWLIHDAVDGRCHAIAGNNGAAWEAPCEEK